MVSLSLISKTNNWVEVEISDTGPGIPDELHEKVFQRFFKPDPNNHEGTGIGLSLVKEYAERLGGTIKLRNNLPSGASFTLSIPALHPSVYDKLEEKVNDTFDDSVSIDGKPVMLIVEGHPDLNNFICSCFENEYDCKQAFDGKQAWGMIRQFVPDIIITDLMMPGITGEEFISRVREKEETSHIPVIVLTAKAGSKNKTKLYGLGAGNYLTKPFESQELIAVVNRVVQQRRQLLHGFYENITTTDTSAPSEAMIENPLILKVMDFISKNLDNHELRTEHLCVALGLGRNKLQREIKEITGLTPVEFIRSVRLEEARKKLKDPYCSVSEVAYAVGLITCRILQEALKQRLGCFQANGRVNRNH